MRAVERDTIGSRLHAQFHYFTPSARELMNEFAGRQSPPANGKIKLAKFFNLYFRHVSFYAHTANATLESSVSGINLRLHFVRWPIKCLDTSDEFRSSGTAPIVRQRFQIRSSHASIDDGLETAERPKTLAQTNHRKVLWHNLTIPDKVFYYLLCRRHQLKSGAQNRGVSSGAASLVSIVMWCVHNFCLDSHAISFFSPPSSQSEQQPNRLGPVSPSVNAVKVIRSDFSVSSRSFRHSVSSLHQCVHHTTLNPLLVTKKFRFFMNEIVF